MTQQDEWLSSRVAYLKALKSPTDMQVLMIALAEKQERTADEEKKLAALVKADKAAQRAAKARQAADRLIQSEQKAAKVAERKARNHRLIQQGILIDLAGLEGRSRGELLGLLLAASRHDDAEKWAEWKRRGDELLAEKDRQVKEWLPRKGETLS